MLAPHSLRGKHSFRSRKTHIVCGILGVAELTAVLGRSRLKENHGIGLSVLRTTGLPQDEDPVSSIPKYTVNASLGFAAVTYYI